MEPNPFQEMEERAREIVTSRASKKDVSRAVRRAVAAFIVIVLVTVYVSVDVYQIYFNNCVQQSYLSHARARTCNSLFIGDRNFTPGPQYSTKLDPSTIQSSTSPSPR